LSAHVLPSSGSSASPAPATCPICQASDLEQSTAGRDRLFNLVRGIFALFRCKSCGCVFQYPLPDSAALAAFYPKEYWWSGTPPTENGRRSLLLRLEKAYREFVTRDHARFLCKCARGKPASERLLLDIGCGNGTFLHVAQQYGFRPHGMDVSARAVEIAVGQYGIPVRQGEIGSRGWDDQNFDFITMFHVLEHLPEPKLALEKVRELLRPAGRLIIQVPNISSVQARIFGTLWYGLDVPRHVINFTPRALGHLLKEAGFEFQLSTRFSLRDNPASIASSLVPQLDPIRRKSRSRSSPLVDGPAEIVYFGLFLLALLPAFLESLLHAGGTIWACAWKKQPFAGVEPKAS
jgi:2-polyprenyl-3-methyl-5-hydroxy-6-metoxy-1,4-benzoquinol methylase